MSKKKEISFEARMQRIRAIADAMQSSQLGLEENLALYQEAQALIKDCHEFLESAELQIRQVTESGGLIDPSVEL